MSACKVTAALRADIEKFYRLREPICNADVLGEYKMLVRKGFDGIVGNSRLEALRDVFTRHGCDPVHGVSRKEV